MHCRELPLALFILMFISTSETCTSRPRITAVEGEPFYLKYCSSLPGHANEENTIRWSKSSGSRGHAELSPGSSSRIALHGYALEFWPVELDDTGSYIFQRGNDTHNWKLNVTQRDKHSCFTKKQVISRTVEVKQSLRVSCENSYYQKLINRTSLYKDCEKIAENNKNPFIQKNAEFKDQGIYTCVFSLYHNGKLFNITKTFNITIAGDLNNINPVIFGPEVNDVEVELGKNVQLNCSALINEMDLVYWNILKENGTNPNVYEEEGMRIRTSEGKWHASKILRIENITDDNLNFSYNCTVVGEGGIDTIRFILFKKEDIGDIPGYIFTRGMLISALVLVAVVCLVTVCVMYRVDLVLFYRHLTGRDETLTDVASIYMTTFSGWEYRLTLTKYIVIFWIFASVIDGKTYDAFVSYLKKCGPEDGEEHTFAVETLPRVLEKHFGYKLCIFERDVVPGGAVVDEIHSLIEKSRRLIIVLSENYMSNEVRYELQSGLHAALVERKIKIILIEFTPISDFTFLPQSLELLKSHRILKWKSDQYLSYDSRFWKNLLYLMPAKKVKPDRDEGEVLPVLSLS